MVLDYDPWMVMEMLHEKLRLKSTRNKVDSHIEIRKYKEGVNPNSDTYSIRLNK